MNATRTPNCTAARSSRRQPSPAVIVAAIVLAACAPALAQEDETAGGATAPPAREGNIYDHKDHQPTEADLRAAAKAAGIAPPASPGKQQVEEEVKKLLDQTDALDNESEQQERDHRSGSSAGPADGR